MRLWQLAHLRLAGTQGGLGERRRRGHAGPREEAHLQELATIFNELHARANSGLARQSARSTFARLVGLVSLFGPETTRSSAWRVRGETSYREHRLRAAST